MNLLVQQKYKRLEYDSACAAEIIIGSQTFEGGKNLFLYK